MAEIRKVALAGATGTLGSQALKALLEADFDVTVLTRSQTSVTQDERIRVVEVDYGSVQSLTSALQGHDAVISTVSSKAIEGQKVLIDAAVAAGVKRFIPSDFSSCSISPKVQELPVYSSLVNIQKYLADKAAAGALSYTILASGCFLEFFIKFPAIIDFAGHKVVLVDGGDNRVSATSIAGVGQAIVGVLKNPGSTKNRVVKVSQAILTQGKLLDIAKQLRPEIEWNVSNTSSTAILQRGLDAFASGEPGGGAVADVLVGTVLGGEEYGSAFDVTDNELLGVEVKTQDEIKKLVAGILN